MVPAPGFLMLLSMFPGTCYIHVEMMGIHNPSDEGRNIFPACSNIVHVRDQRTYWPEIIYRHPANGYDHDRQYFRHLKNYFEPVHITGGAYFVMHVPRQYDL